MGYSIGQVAKKTGLSVYTLRYYEKEGLLPFIRKNSSGLRVFSDADLNWLGMIECLKSSGMPLKSIRQYIDWYNAGDSTLSQRLQMFKHQAAIIQTKIQKLELNMSKIQYKIRLYEEAAKQGSLNLALENPELKSARLRLFGH